MRIFLGFNNNAGILSRLKKGFEELGIGADFYSFNEHVYGYKSDRLIKYSSVKPVRQLQKSMLLLKLILKYKYFIFDSGESLLPGFKDIRLFRSFKKKCMMIFTGCDSRIPEAVENFKWNPCTYCSDTYKDYVGCVIERKKSMLDEVENNFDILVAPEEAGGFLKRDYFKTLFPVYLPDLPKNKLSNRGSNRIKILHAPSHEEYKGTKYILAAIDRLKEEFAFDFSIVKGVSINKLYEEIESSDILIDQVLVGFYGLISIEAMAMNKPVVCYIRNDIWNNIKYDCPVFNADPDSIYEVLKVMLNDMNSVKKQSDNGRAYVEKYHDAKVIASQYLELFKSER